MLLQSANGAIDCLQGFHCLAAVPPALPTNLSIFGLSTVSLHACRALAVLLGLYSLAVVVAEATITPALPNMSIFSQTLSRVAHNTIACEMLCFLFLIYPCCAAYFAIYKLGRWSFYLLVPRRGAAAGLFGRVSLPFPHPDAAKGKLAPYLQLSATLLTCSATRLCTHNAPHSPQAMRC